MQERNRAGLRISQPEHGASPIERAKMPIARFTTADITVAHKFPTWTARGWPSVAALFDVTPSGPFDTRADQVVLDGLIVQFAWGTARRFERTAARTADGIDTLAINIMLTPGTVMTVHGTSRRVDAGDAVLIDATQPSMFELPEGHSIQLVLPRGLAAEHLGAVGELHGLVIPAARAEMLTAHLNQIQCELMHLSPVHGPRLARTIIDIVAIATEREHRTAPPPGPGYTVVEVIKSTIEANLSQPNLGIRWLTRRLNLSRSAIYRAFHDEDGVESYIRARRLERVRECLSNPQEAAAIGNLAARWGFCDSSHLSRSFRDRFGVSPSAYRAERSSQSASASAA